MRLRWTTVVPVAAAASLVCPNKGSRGVAVEAFSCTTTATSRRRTSSTSGSTGSRRRAKTLLSSSSSLSKNRHYWSSSAATRTLLQAVSVVGAAESTHAKTNRAGWHRRLLNRVVRGRSSSPTSSSSSIKTSQQRRNEGSMMQSSSSTSRAAVAVSASSEYSSSTATDFLSLSSSSRSNSPLDQITLSSSSSSSSTDPLQSWSNATDDDDAASFILQDYERISPSVVLPPELLDDSHATGTSSSSEEAEDRGSVMARVTRGWAETALSGLLDRWSHGLHENLRVQCEPQNSHNLVELLVRGYFRCDAVVEFDRIQFPRLQISGGGRLESDRLALNLYRFKNMNNNNNDNKKPMSDGSASSNGKVKSKNSNKGENSHTPRFPDQFDLTAHDIVFEEHDLFGSSCIRNGLARLMTRILKGRGLMANQVEISSIAIFHAASDDNKDGNGGSQQQQRQSLVGGKISCKGEARVLGSPVPFEVRSGLATTSRGHVLTFPGLEISLAGNLPLFMPVRPEITVDLGHNAQIHKVCIDSAQKTLTVSCKATIAPRHTVKLSGYQQDKQAYAADHYVDVGSWLTRIGKFSN